MRVVGVIPEDLERVPIEFIQPVACTEPHISLFVLVYAGDVQLR